jgi:YihY family inner membrane protein
MELLRRFDRWQQRHPVPGFVVAVILKFNDDQAGSLVALLSYYAFVAMFPLLLVLVSVTGIVLRSSPRLQHDLVNSAFSEFPIIGGQIHSQLGVTAFGHTTLALTIGILGAIWGARGFAGAIANTLYTVWAVPKVDRPGFPSRYLHMFGLLALVALWVVLTAATTAIAQAGSALGLSAVGLRIGVVLASMLIDAALLLAVFRLAISAAVPTKAMLGGAVVAAIVWQLLLNLAGLLVSHSMRHAQEVAGLFGLVLGLLGWLALQATVTVYAIEADVVRVRNLWPRSLFGSPLTEADKAYLVSVAGIETRTRDQHVDTEFGPPEHA